MKNKKVMCHDEGEDYMKYNVFDNDEREANTLSHADMELIISDAKRFGSLKDSVLAHAEEYGYSQDIADEWGDSLAHAYPHKHVVWIHQLGKQWRQMVSI